MWADRVSNQGPLALCYAARHNWLNRGSCMRRDRAGKGGTEKRDHNLRAQEKVSDIK